MKPTFLKNIGTFLKNIKYKNIGPKNVAVFCKMLTKIFRNVEEKNVEIFLI
jgi:hypothetical protein